MWLWSERRVSVKKMMVSLTEECPGLPAGIPCASCSKFAFQCCEIRDITADSGKGGGAYINSGEEQTLNCWKMY